MKHYGTLIIRLRRSNARACLPSIIREAMSEFCARFQTPMSSGIEDAHTVYIAQYALDWVISIHALCQSDASIARSSRENPVQEFESRVRISDDYCFTVIVQIHMDGSKALDDRVSLCKSLSDLG